MKEATAQPPRRNLWAQQQAFDEFRRHYNEERPHEALGQQPPAQHYGPSGRDYPARLSQPEYPDEWLKRKVRLNGVIQLKQREVYLSQALTGQCVGLQPVADGLWQIHFMQLGLACYDERKKCVRPLTNNPVASKKL